MTREWQDRVFMEDCKAAAALVGKRVRFAHMPDLEEDYHLVITAHGGMIELEGWVGQFAPHLFVVHP